MPTECAWKDRFQAIYSSMGIKPEQEKFDRAFYDADDNLPSRHNLEGVGFAETVDLQVGDMFSNLGAGPGQPGKGGGGGPLYFPVQSRA